LREVAEGEALGVELLFKGGAENPGLKGGGRRERVQPQHTVHPLQVQSNGRIGAKGFDASEHGGAAAEGDDGDPLVSRCIQQRGHLLLRLRIDDGIGGVRNLPSADTHEVAIALAQAVDGPVNAVSGEGGRA
jgi:hypothetical protein